MIITHACAFYGAERPESGPGGRGWAPISPHCVPSKLRGFPNEVTRARWLNPQTGIETGSPRLIEAHMPGKCCPFTPEDWPQTVIDAFTILQENHWVPSATLIMGLPGEVDEDIEQTVELVEKLRDFRSLIVPVFFVAQGTLAGKAKSSTLEDARPLNKELFVKCWQHNLRWSSNLFNQYSTMLIRNSIRRHGLRIAKRLMEKVFVRRLCSKLG